MSKETHHPNATSSVQEAEAGKEGLGLKIRKIGESVVDSEALNFTEGAYGKCVNGRISQQDSLASHKGFQYATYYDAARRICVARRKLPKGKWQVIRFDDYHIQGFNDTHNVTVLGICPGDGTIHLAFDHHASPLHYRVSRKQVATRPDEFQWEPSLFGAVTSELQKGKRTSAVTYPRFFSTPKGGLQFYYRIGGAGKGDGHLNEYDPESGTWQHLGMITSKNGKYGNSRSRGPYTNGFDYDADGRLHVTWVWRELSKIEINTHDLQYAYSDDFGRVWCNSKGVKIGALGTANKQKRVPIHVNSPGVTVYDIPLKWGLENQFSQAIDHQGRIHTVLWHNPPHAPRPNQNYIHKGIRICSTRSAHRIYRNRAVYHSHAVRTHGASPPSRYR